MSITYIRVRTTAERDHPGRLQRVQRDQKRRKRLPVRVTGMQDAVRTGCGGARGQRPLAPAHHPAIAVALLPRSPARESLDDHRASLCHNDAQSTDMASMVKTEPRPLIVKITCGAEAAERANQGRTVAAWASRPEHR